MLAVATTPDYLRRARWCCIAAWLASCLGVVLAIITTDWLVAIYALLCALSAAGWIIAMHQWEEWREIARGLMSEAERREDG